MERFQIADNPKEAILVRIGNKSNAKDAKDELKNAYEGKKTPNSMYLVLDSELLM